MATSPHTLQTPKPLWSEQNPEEWWQATSASIQAVLKKAGISGAQVSAVGLTGQMHGLVLLDGSGEVLRPAILWNDQRTQSQCDEIHRLIGKQLFIKITGNVALPGFTAPKILWVRQNEPEVFARVRQILLPKDYLRFRLTGDYAMDKADGSGTVLFDLARRNWSSELLLALGIDPRWMPPTFEGSQVTGRVSAAAAKITGLKAGTPVVAGGGDQAAQSVGVGAVESGIVAMTLGTSGVVFASTSAPLIEPEGRLHAFCHAVPGTWHLMGVMLSAAGSLQWFHDNLTLSMGFDELLYEAEGAPAGSQGLQFLPYLSGERTPYPDPLARAGFVGLTIRHKRAHMTRALLEGVAYGIKDNFKLIQNAGLGSLKQVRASGGGTKGALWREIMATVLETELVTVNTTEGAAFGAALLAGVGVGVWPDVPTACENTIKITGSVKPNVSDLTAYRDGYQVYSELYHSLEKIFHKMKD